MTTHHKEQILFLFYASGKDLWEISWILNEPFSEVREYFYYARSKYKRLCAKFERWRDLRPPSIGTYTYTGFFATNADSFREQLIWELGKNYQKRLNIANRNFIKGATVKKGNRK